MAGGYRVRKDGVEGITRHLRNMERTIQLGRSAATLLSAVIGRGGVTVRDGGNIYVLDNGAIRAIGPTSLGTVENGRFGVVTLDPDGSFAYPSFVTTPDGFLADAGPSVGYAVVRVDPADGALVLSSSTNVVRLAYTTTSAAANARILTNGQVQQSTSSRRYKQDIVDAEIDADLVLQLRARSWRDRAEVEQDPDTDQRYVGFIAEELDELGLTMFVDYDAEGRPDAIQYDRISVALLALAKDQARHLDDLDARLARLEQAANGEDES